MEKDDIEFELMTKIMNHKEAVLKKYPEYQILGIFLYGSQNYNIATEKSDVDIKAIIIPTVEQLAFSPVRVGTIEFSDGGHCEIMSIVHWVENLKKQNVNFVETLFTQYRWINPFYLNKWKETFLEKREDIANYDKDRMVKSICHQAINTLSRYDTGKSLANGYRFRYFLYNKLKGVDYLKCIKVSNPLNEYLIELKLDKTIGLESERKALVNWFDMIKDQNYHVDVVKKAALDKELIKITLSFIDEAEIKKKLLILKAMN
jgi:predicted nucleotidyltransferase